MSARPPMSAEEAIKLVLRALYYNNKDKNPAYKNTPEYEGEFNYQTTSEISARPYEQPNNYTLNFIGINSITNKRGVICSIKVEHKGSNDNEGCSKDGSEQLRVTLVPKEKPNLKPIVVLLVSNLNGSYQTVIYRPGRWVEILREKESYYFADIDDAAYFS